MMTKVRTVVFSSVALAVVLLSGVEANAQKAKVWPPSNGGPSYPVPRLGFASYFDGVGEHVTGVRPGSRAWRMGLEPGDIILAVNGYRVRYDGQWNSLMRRAARHGHVTLAIRDWRTGNTVYRRQRLGNGPIISIKSGG